MAETLRFDTRHLMDTLDSLHNLLDGDQRARLLLLVGERVGIAAVALAGEYPSQSGKPLPKFYTRQRADGTSYLSKFKSQKQQGYVFGVLVKGGQLPYTRTGRLGASLTHDARLINSQEVDVRVGTNLDYAQHVIGLEQSRYHEGNWNMLPITLDNNRAVFEQEIERTLAAALQLELGR